MADTPRRDHREIPNERLDTNGPRHELEQSRSSTQDSLKCRSCGAMFDTSEHMEASVLTCPVCGHHETTRIVSLQSSDQGF